MAHGADLQKQIQRIGQIVEQLESTTDASVRAIGKELLESLMALHGAAIERILELVSETGEAGDAIIRKCAGDELVASLFLLYGLHPDDLPTRVTRALEKSRPYLQSHAARAELESLSDDGRVVVRLEVKSSGCGSSAASVKSILEAALQDAAPDAASIIVQEAGAALTQSGFISLAQLQGAQAMPRVPVASAQRGGD
jgi:Fe-S cluster biogenesis protein NfuA